MIDNVAEMLGIEPLDVFTQAMKSEYGEALMLSRVGDNLSPPFIYP